MITPILANKEVRSFDVRNMLADGNDPLKEILQKFSSLKNNEVLCIINGFIPLPLIRLLEGKNAKAYTETVGPGEYHTYFIPEAGAPSTPREESGIIMEDQASFESACANIPPDTRRDLDVRTLEMPRPMQEILAALEQLPQGHALYVFHKRVPVHLLEDLAGQAYDIHITSLSEKDVRLLIIKR